MITTADRFVHAQPTRLVLADPTQRRRGAGALYRAGELVEQRSELVLSAPQSAGRSR
jgi:hypothetical protein